MIHSIMEVHLALTLINLVRLQNPQPFKPYCGWGSSSVDIREGILILTKSSESHALT